MNAYELLKKSTSMTEVISILKDLKDIYKNDIVIRLIPINEKDPLSSIYMLSAKMGKDAWYLPIGEGTYDILKEVIN
jgi:Mor family transcriptional regulator